MDRKTKIPITRANMWYDESDFEVDIEFAKEFMENDSNFKVVIFQVDRANTQLDDVYGESETADIRYLPPVEMIVSALNIEEAEMEAYNQGQGSLNRRDKGTLSFAVFTDELKNKGIDIRNGDFIGYAITEAGLQYWEVFNDGRMNFDNQHTLYGIKPYYRTIKCHTVDSTQFNAQ